VKSHDKSAYAQASHYFTGYKHSLCTQKWLKWKRKKREHYIEIDNIYKMIGGKHCPLSKKENADEERYQQFSQSKKKKQKMCINEIKKEVILRGTKKYDLTLYKGPNC